MSEENNLSTKKDIKGLTEEEGENLKAILKHFVESYMKNRDTMELDEWLAFEFKNNLEGISDDEAKKMSDEIIESLKAAEESKASLENAIKQGRSKESWFASQIKKATADMSDQEAAEFLNDLEQAINETDEDFNENGKSCNEKITSFNKATIKQMAMNLIKKICKFALKRFMFIDLDSEELKNALKDENVESSEEIEKDLILGNDFGLKVAAAGALKVASEKGVVKELKGATSDVISNIAYVGIENIKTQIKVAQGVISAKEGMDEYEKTTVSSVAALIFEHMRKYGKKIGKKVGEKVGKKIGSIFGKKGEKIGEKIGSNIGSMTGYKMADAIAIGAEKIGSYIEEKAKEVGNKALYKLKNKIDKKLSTLSR